jgi:hypothetical protein
LEDIADGEVFRKQVIGIETLLGKGKSGSDRGERRDQSFYPCAVILLSH